MQESSLLATYYLLLATYLVPFTTVALIEISNVL
jgi:hypothetical protein